MTELRTSETKLEFPYTRTVGPIVGAFLTGLRDGKLLGTRNRDGRVLFPAVEYDPETGEALTETVEVGPEGTVDGWTWVAHPTPKHPLDRPFAFALIRPDGADTAMVHAVDAGDEATMSTGMRVAPRFRQEAKGIVTDLEAWEPVR
ncbi:MAG TPA: OB-fold domain-containing protein [Acidimicrobiales bacterium]|nr:OB-fold domain-containing protein [Acidimicrobiales bacterium]